ncbi:MAG: tetratricopeptide repeat protein [Porticoccaceae bacterium]|nr:tetratricopeptide repeat protein [Porticoccaceae bacterium]
MPLYRDRAPQGSWRFSPALLMAVLLLPACAATVAPSPPQDQQLAPEVSAVETAPPVYRPFPVNSLFELLVAEFAGIRGDIEPAIEIYLNQAYETRDPAVIERAIRIASFVGLQDVVLNLAELWVEVEPAELDVRRLVAFHLARAGRVVEAFPHAEYLLLAGDDNHLQALAAFAVDTSDGEKDRLLALYEELAVNYPDRVGLMLGRAMLLRQVNRPEESLALAAQVIKADPGNETGQLLHAQLLHQVGQPTRAIRSLEKALAEEPVSKRLRLQYARFLAETDLALSREQMVLLVEQFPEDPDLLFSLALASQELGMSSEAESLYQALIDRHQRTGDAHYQLGRLAEIDGSLPRALDHYRRVDSGSSMLAATVRIVEILAGQGDVLAASEHLALLREAQPANAATFFQIEAEMLVRTGRLAEARHLLDSALESQPGNPNLLYSRSVVSARQDDIESAEADLRAILVMDPDNATALNALGYTLTTSTDRHHEALELVGRALELEPDNPAIIDSLGWVHYQLGNFAEALALLHRAYEAFPDPEVAAHLGEVLWMSGQHEEARRVWSEALDRPSDNHGVILETMQRLSADTAAESDHGGD